MHSNKLRLKPLVTEKSSQRIEDKQFTFQLLERVNKIELKQFFQKEFSVLPERINILKQAGKKRRRGRLEGFTPGKVIAIVSFGKEQDTSKIQELF